MASNIIMNRTKLRVIGDVHGHYRQYLELIKVADYSIQLGDFGFDYKCLDEVDASCHKIVPGNHDNYERLPPHALCCPGFGEVTLGEYKLFYIRGAYSIDKQYRTPGVSWWSAEELSTAGGTACVEKFAEVKPDFVVSHDCPLSIYQFVLNNPWFIQQNWTSRILEQCWQRHQPLRWVFGHHHKNWSEKINGTRFHCLTELQCMDFGSYCDA